MRLAWAFFCRDATIALSYRAAFFMQFLGNVVLLGLLYYMGKAVGPQSLPALERYGGNFLAFVLIGIALTDCVLVSLMSFATQVREAQTTGTLEATLLAPVSLSTILIYSSLWSYFLSAVRFLLYLVVGALLYDLNLGRADLLAAAIIFLLTVLCFMGIGILMAGIVLLVKRGEAILSVLGYVVMLVTGVLFPVTLLPAWMQKLSALIPLTHALEGMRFALLQGQGIRDLAPIILTLVVFAAALLTAGVVSFNLAVRTTKHTGSLTQY